LGVSLDGRSLRVAGVKIEVVEGRFVEAMIAAATGMDRRAFGEFVGPQGELASYAFGWTTGSDPHVAQLSVGIGAGNPGGGAFHAVAFVNDDGHTYSLVDEPFEDLPEGGPDLTAVQARAHRDLPFVWWVVDRVMERDRRAWWMRHWLLGTNSIRPSKSSSVGIRHCSSVTTPTTGSGNLSARRRRSRDRQHRTSPPRCR
jgi:hypothetical protein